MNVRPGRFQEFTARVDDLRLPGFRRFQGLVQEVEGFMILAGGFRKFRYRDVRVWGVGLRDIDLQEWKINRKDPKP